MTDEDLWLPFRGARCLVTGGAGFIGSNLTRALLGCGADVTVLDSLVIGKRDHLPRDPGLSLVEQDLCESADLPEIVATSDYVFHLAAHVGNIKSIENPEEDARTNVQGSVRLFWACRGTAVRRVVYSSSSAGYGEARVLPITEDAPQNPESFYALSKFAAERYALLAASLCDVPIACLRYFNVFGLPMENNEYTGVISIFFDRLRTGRPLVIFGDGQQFRDFVYVADVVQANLLAALCGRPGGVYNVGSGRSTSITQLAEAMIGVTGRDSEIEYRKFRAGEVRRSVADITRAKEELGYEPVWAIDRGLAEMWQRLNQ